MLNSFDRSATMNTKTRPGSGSGSAIGSGSGSGSTSMDRKSDKNERQEVGSAYKGSEVSAQQVLFLDEAVFIRFFCTNKPIFATRLRILRTDPSEIRQLQVTTTEASALNHPDPI